MDDVIFDFEQEIKIHCTNCRMGSDDGVVKMKAPTKREVADDLSKSLVPLSEKECPRCDQKTLVERTW